MITQEMERHRVMPVLLESKGQHNKRQKEIGEKHKCGRPLRGGARSCDLTWCMMANGQN